VHHRAANHPMLTGDPDTFVGQIETHRVGFPPSDGLQLRLNADSLE
jgi:hypothetical protein